MKRRGIPRHYEGIPARIPSYLPESPGAFWIAWQQLRWDATDNAFLLPMLTNLESGPALAAPCISQVGC